MKLTTFLFSSLCILASCCDAVAVASERDPEKAHAASFLRPIKKTRGLSTAHFKCGPTETDFEWCMDEKQECVDNACQCVRGRHGDDCSDLDICKEAYPCPGGFGSASSFCVDEDPPAFYKCGCMPDYDAVLPVQTDVIDPVPAAWRPTQCVKKASTPETDADTPVVLSEGPSASPTTGDSCHSDQDCGRFNESCDMTQSPPFCNCGLGFFRLDGGSCGAEDFCSDPARNNCDYRFEDTSSSGSAECTNVSPSFVCRCREENGWIDALASIEPGTICIDRDECALGEDTCDPALNEVCVNRVPVNGKYECVQKTSSPTPSPTTPPTPPAPKCSGLGDACEGSDSAHNCCAGICQQLPDRKIRLLSGSVTYTGICSAKCAQHGEKCRGLYDHVEKTWAQDDSDCCNKKKVCLPLSYPAKPDGAFIGECNDD